MGEREMHRLRLAEAARQIELDARVAREALFRFDEQQRLLDQADIAASKRKIQSWRLNRVLTLKAKGKRHTCRASLISHWERLGLRVNERQLLS